MFGAALYSISKYLFKGSITAGEKVITIILDLWLGSLCSLDLRTHINTVVIQSIQFVYNISKKIKRNKVEMVKNKYCTLDNKPFALPKKSKLQYRHCLLKKGYVCIEVNGVKGDICCQLPSGVF